jgi:citrate synthase
MARVVGWSAHRIEELVNVDKIIRPAYLSVSERKVYQPLEIRGEHQITGEQYTRIEK